MRRGFSLIMNLNESDAEIRTGISVVDTYQEPLPASHLSDHLLTDIGTFQTSK